MNTIHDTSRYEDELKSIQGKYSPGVILLITIMGIAVAEIIAMVVIYFFRDLPYYQQVLLDAGIMTVIIFPLLYFLSFRPLLLHIQQRYRAENEIEERNQREKLLTQTIHTMQLDIARDLHDTVGQNISLLRMKLDFLAGNKSIKKSDMQVEIESMTKVANESYDLMRGTLAVLQSVNSADLFRVFSRYAEQIEERAAFKVTFASQGEPQPLSAKRMRQLFFVFREILNNIEKHASATQVSVQIAWQTECLIFTVMDNGQGFDSSDIEYSGHFGLKFMRDRVEMLNGLLEIQSHYGAGTNIVIQVPYE